MNKKEYNIKNIFGGKPKEDDMFIIVHIFSVKNSLIQLASLDNDSIWTINDNIMHDVFKTYNFNYDNYCSFGHLWFTKLNIEQPFSILLARKATIVTKYPVGYEIAGRYNKGFVWKPICPLNYTALGYIYSEDMPKLNIMCVLNNKFVIPYNSKYYAVDNFNNMNEFSLIGYKDTEKVSLNRIKLLKNEKKFKLKNKSNNKYLSGDKNNNLIYSDEEKSNINSSINYTTQGELKVNEKCISMDNNNYVGLKECNGLAQQKWYPYMDHYISAFNKKCLFQNNNDTSAKKCTGDNNKQKWDTLDITTINSDNSNKGKTVILVESDNPWYLNKEYSHGIDLNSYVSEIPKSIDSISNQGKIALYNSNFVMKPNEGSQGYGHSFADRQGVPCPCDKVNIETFDESLINLSDIMDYAILIVIILIIIILILKI